MGSVGRIVLVTPFPHSSHQSHGVAAYSRELAGALHEAGGDVEVWADRLPGDPEEHLSSTAYDVLRLWRPGAVAGAGLMRALRRRRPGLIHVQLEHFVFGGLPGLASLHSFLLAVRLSGVPLYVTIHHVASAQVSREILRASGIKISPAVARRLQAFMARYLGALAARVIVHDDIFRRRLVTDAGLDASRIEVIPHGVPLPRPRGRSVSPTLLMFGYLKWYKGIDIAIEAFRQLLPDVPSLRLIIAGGVPPALGRPQRGFFEYIHRLAADLGRSVEFLGYVPDERIPEVYDAADVVLFPYRVLFGASGPLALAIGYRKPFIVSEMLKPLVPFWPLTTPNTPSDWAAAIRHALAAPDLQGLAESVLEPAASMRQWPRVAAATLESYRNAEAAPRATFEIP